MPWAIMLFLLSKAQTFCYIFPAGAFTFHSSVRVASVLSQPV